MPFPWRVISEINRPLGHIVEDMCYSVELTIADVPPQPCVEAEIVSWLPSQKSGIESQRKRWEHGHLSVILSESPRLWKCFLSTRRINVLAILLELSLSPISLMVAAYVVLFVAVATLSIHLELWFIAIPLMCSLMWFGISLILAWWRFGRDLLPWRRSLKLPLYMLAKIPIQASFFMNRQQAWVRTERGVASPVEFPLPPRFHSETRERKSLRTISDTSSEEP